MAAQCTYTLSGMNMLRISPGLCVLWRINVWNLSAMMQKVETQCERISIEGGRFGAHFSVLDKDRWLYNIDIYI